MEKSGMKFLQDVELDRFDAFVREHPVKSHFMQSVAWGELNRSERGMKPYYVGLENDDGDLVAAALLLERKPPMFPPYFYSPRGFVIDFGDKELLKAFTREVFTFCKKKGAMFLKIDPDIQRKEEEPDGTSLIETLKNLGFRHLGFNNGFERRQPRFTFRIDLKQDEETLIRGIEGNVMKNVRKGERNYATEIFVGTKENISDLYRLITETSERDHFFAYTEQYYQSFYETLDRYGMVKLYMGKTYPKKIADGLRKQLEVLLELKKSYKKEQKIREAEETEKRIHKEIEIFDRYALKYGEEAITNAHLVVRYGRHSWAVHAGSANDMKETFLNNRIYLEKILDQKRTGADWLDQFGTVGNPDESPLRSLHEFKRQFGGQYLEFIGEFDLVIRPSWYFLYEKALPRYRSLLFDLKELGRKRST